MTGYGTVEGLCGANCRHNFFPFFEGISKRNYTDAQLKEMKDHKVTYNGKEYTDYDARQLQRKLERKVRDTKQNLVMIDEARKNVTTDEEKLLWQQEFNTTSVKLKGQEAKLKDFCNQTGFKLDKYRTQVFAKETENGIKNFGKSVSQKSVWANKKSVANYSKSGIIKNITIDDLKDAAYGKNIDKDIIYTIYKSIQTGENSGKMYISEVFIGSIPSGSAKRTVLMQIEPVSAGKMSMCKLNINSDAVSGITLQELDERIKNTKINLAQSLEEAVIHENGHAKAYYQKSISEIEKMNKKIKNLHIDGISDTAYQDGAECIAEVEILLHRRESVPKEALELYNKYIKEK